jgi:hypothetical protein
VEIHRFLKFLSKKAAAAAAAPRRDGEEKKPAAAAPRRDGEEKKTAAAAPLWTSLVLKTLIRISRKFFLSSFYLNFLEKGTCHQLLFTVVFTQPPWCDY